MNKDLIWKTENERFLIQRSMQKLKYAMRLQSGILIRESGEYYLIDNKGMVLSKYKNAESGGLDYEIRLSDIHIVIENVLYNLQISFYPERIETIETRKFINLQPYNGYLPFNVDSAINTFETSRKERSSPISRMPAFIAARLPDTINKAMNWKTMDGTFLVQRNMRKIPLLVVETIKLENEEFYQSAEYFEVTDNGIVLNKYEQATTSTGEYDLFINNIHRVIGDSLYEFNLTQNFPVAESVIATTTNKKLLTGLQPYESELPFDVGSVIYGLEMPEE